MKRGYNVKQLYLKINVKRRLKDADFNLKDPSLNPIDCLIIL